VRYVTLIILVIVFPGAVYWAVNGMAGPGETWERFAGQVDDIRRSQPEPEPEEEPIRRKKPEPEPEKKPEEDKEEEPEEKPDPVTDPVIRAVNAAHLFTQGRFRESAAAYGEAGGRARALAVLGAAFAEAFPEPTDSYLVVELRGGSTQEGFVIADGAEVKLLDPTGRAITLPSSLIVARRSIGKEKTAERTLPRIEEEVASGDARRLFRATAAAFRIGRPDLAGPLLNKVVLADSSAILKAISKDVDRTAQNPLFRAYADAVVVRESRPEPIVTAKRQPRTNGSSSNGQRKNGLKTDGTRKLDGSKKHGKSRRSTVKINDEQARKYMVQARPLRLDGKKLFDKVQVGGLDSAKLDDVETAIRKYEAALDLYEKALEREDSDTIYVLVIGCSKKLFQLRFWKEQLGGR